MDNPPPSAPPSAPSAPMDESPRPKVYALFLMFCALSGMFQLLIFCLGGVAWWLSTNPFAGPRGVDLSHLSPAMFWSAMALFGMSIPLIAVYFVAPFLPRRPWVWKLSVSLIGMGVVSPVFFLAIPVGRRWGEPEVRAWYGLPAAAADNPDSE